MSEIIVNNLNNLAGTSPVVVSDIASKSVDVASKVSSASLSAGSGASLVGYLPSGTDAVATTVQSKLRESVSVKDFGNTSAAFLAAVADIGSMERTLIVNVDTTISANFTVPVNITLRFDRGAVISIATGVTLTVLSTIDAGDYVCFSGLGTLDLNAGSAYFNLAWFDGEHLNDKWDFVKRGLVSLRPYTVYLPKPEIGMQGAVVYPSTSNLIYWGIDAPLQFPDKCNAGTWIQYSSTRIRAVATMDSMMEFSSDPATGKIEDVQFPFGAWLDGNTTSGTPLAYYGIKMLGAARVDFDGLLQITDCSVPFYGNCTETALNSSVARLYVARWAVSAVLLEGSNDGIVATRFGNVHCEVPYLANTDCIVIKGTVRDLKIDHIFYSQATTGALQLNNLVLVQSTASGYPVGIKIGSITTTSAMVTTAFKTENSGGSVRAFNTIVDSIYCASGTVSANLGYDVYTSIGVTSTPIVYGTNCYEPKPGSNIIARTYDFAVLGGAVGTYVLGGTLPKDSTVVKAWYIVETALASSGAAVFRIGTNVSLSGIKASTIYSDAAAWSVGLHDGIPDFTAANALPKVTASTTGLAVVIGTAALTAGKVTIYVQVI